MECAHCACELSWFDLYMQTMFEVIKVIYTHKDWVRKMIKSIYITYASIERRQETEKKNRMSFDATLSFDQNLNQNISFVFFFVPSK